MLTHDYQATQWRGPILTKAIQQLCFQSEWEEADWLVIDMPPGTGDVQMSIFESLEIKGVVAVTTPQDLALLDVKSLSLVAKYDLNLYGILENMSFHQCTKCKHISFPFGKIQPQEIIRDYGYKHLGYSSRPKLIKKQFPSNTRLYPTKNNIYTRYNNCKPHRKLELISEIK